MDDNQLADITGENQQSQQTKHYNENSNNNNISDIVIQQHPGDEIISQQMDSLHSETSIFTTENSNSLNVSVDELPGKILISPDVTKNSLTQSAQQIIDDLNAKRKQDTQLLSNIKKALEAQNEKMCKSIEQHLFQVYETQGKEVQDKLQELFGVIDRISRVETELQEFKQALQILYKDMTD
ncbi:synaptonemal complex central element protein 2 [Patella vulgata]|uniref:synaptonemal complex central element protein 2 n=1 Tax=Patella vulgata TaxID=6465 RepID=UPI00217F7CE8|nr:synaptonemal complex central element protein 2 [Patella vulgata]